MGEKPNVKTMAPSRSRPNWCVISGQTVIAQGKVTEVHTMCDIEVIKKVEVGSH